MMPKKVTVSIIIRAYNEEKRIERLFEGIREQRIPFAYETILVDSGSTDKTVSIAKTYNAKILSVAPKEFSFGHSLNVGMAAASGPFCVFISGHGYPVNNKWLENLLKPFEDLSIALVYGKQRGNGVTKFSEHQIFAQWFPETGGKQREPFCNNANTAIRRSLWEEHRYDESLTGLEDIAWAKNAISRGYSLYYAPEACIIHEHDESWRKVYRRYEREAMAMKSIYAHERFRLSDFFSLFIMNTVADYKRAAAQNMLMRNIFQIPAMRFMQFWGTYCGYKVRKPVTSRLRQRLYYPNRPDVFKKSGIS